MSFDNLENEDDKMKLNKSYPTINNLLISNEWTPKIKNLANVVVKLIFVSISKFQIISI